MIPVGQPYRAAGTLDAKSLLITAILATTAAVLGAAAVWLWELSPIPTLLILTPLIQGAGVGAVMAFAIGRLRLRNPRTVAVVAFLCGLFSNGLVHYGHYLHLVSVTATQLKDEVALDKSMPEEKRAELLARLEAAPATIVDSILAQETQHSGFVGSLFLRNRQGITIKSSAVTGTMLWIVWAAEALLVAIIASVIAAERAARPFCEDCGYWCEKHADLFAIPATAADSLVQAVRESDHSQIARLRSSPLPDSGSSTVGATLHSCPACDQSFADVSHRIVKKKETKVKVLLKQHRVSPEVVDIIRSGPHPGTSVNEAAGKADESHAAGESEGFSPS
jgi:hypothetical protein